MQIFTGLDLEGLSTEDFTFKESGEAELSLDHEIACLTDYRSRVVANLRDAWDDMDWDRVERLDALYDELSREIATLSAASSDSPRPVCLSGCWTS